MIQLATTEPNLCIRGTTDGEDKYVELTPIPVITADLVVSQLSADDYHCSSILVHSGQIGTVTGWASRLESVL